MDDNDYGDFVVYMSEDRGERDVALLFDARWIHGIEPFEYVERALDTAGPAFEGAWQQFGSLGEGRNAKAALDLLEELIVAARQCDFPEVSADVIVATLGGLSKTRVEYGLAALRRDSAFLGYVDISGPSEFRASVAGLLDWVN